MIKFSSANFSAVMGKQVAAEVRAHFADKGSKIGQDIAPQLEKIAEKIVAKAVPAMDAEIKMQYSAALNVVGNHLKQGFPTSGAGEWKPFTTAYAKYKTKMYPGTAGLFWIRSGELAADFARRSGGWKGAMNRTKTAIALQGVTPRAGGTRFTFTLNARTPKIGDPIFDVIFREAFVNPSDTVKDRADAAYRLPREWGKATPLERLCFNEFKQNMHRPFVTKLMQERGKTMQKDLIAILRKSLR